jgi:hypothetical protein
VKTFLKIAMVPVFFLVVAIGGQLGREAADLTIPGRAFKNLTFAEKVAMLCVDQNKTLPQTLPNGVVWESVSYDQDSNTRTWKYTANRALLTPDEKKAMADNLEQLACPEAAEVFDQRIENVWRYENLRGIVIFSYRCE